MTKLEIQKRVGDLLEMIEEFAQEILADFPEQASLPWHRRLLAFFGKPPTHEIQQAAMLCEKARRDLLEKGELTSALAALDFLIEQYRSDAVHSIRSWLGEIYAGPDSSSTLYAELLSARGSLTALKFHV